MVLQNQPGYSNPPISPGDTILNVDGMAASHASVEQLCAMLNGPIHSVVHLTLARRTGELFTACLLRHTLPESKAPSTGGSRSAGDSQQSNPPPAFFDIQGLQADESLLVQKPENPNMARSAPQTAARAAQQRQAFENVSSEVVYTAPASSPESYYFVAPQFGRVLQKSGVMWRRGDSTESLRNATGSWWDLGSEKCACTLEGGYFNIRSIADKAIEDSLELSQWTMDDSDDRMGGHMTLIHISTGRLVKLFAESDQAGEDWRRAILQCMPKSIPPVTSLMDSRSEIPEMHVPATIAGQVPRSSRAAPPVVASGLTISHQYISNAVDPAYRESRLRDMQYARTYGTLRCCFAHWKVFGLKSVVGVTVEAYRPADEAHKVEALLVGDLIAIRGSNGEGMSRGWHLPNDRWDALAKYPREIWFPTNSVSVECDASGYWGRVWPLTINVLGARHLPSQGGKKRPDPYVTVQVGNMRHEIDRRNKTSNPVWVELVEFEVEGDEMVSFVVWDWNDVKRDETIGFLEISAGRLVQDGEVAFEESVSQSRPSDKDPQAFAIFPGTKGYKLFTENGSEVQGPNNDEALLFVQAFPQAKSSNVSNAVHTMQDLSGCFQDHASDSMANALVLKTEEPQDIKVMHTPDQRHAPAPVTETMLELHANTLLMANDKISSDSIEESSSRWTVGIISISGQNSVFELCVEDFEAGSSAAYAGLQAGDVIIQVENVDIKGVEAEEAERLLIGPAGSFVTITASRRTDDKISMHTVELMRDVPVSKMLKYREVANKVGEKTSEKTSNSDSTVAMASAGPFKIVRLVRGETGSIGMTIVPAGPNVDGAGLWKIANLLPDSPAYQSGQLKVGDIIRAIDQECRLSGNVEDVISILKGQPGTPVSIEVQSGDAPPLPQHVQNDHVNIEFKLPKWAEEFAFADPVPKEYTFKIWIISAQHQPTKNFMGQGMRMIKLSTCDANGVSGISFEASYRNNKEHPIIEQGCFLHFNETYAYLQVAVDEVGKCSLSVEQLKDVAKASLPRSAQRDMTQQSEIKSSKSLTKSLSKSLSFKKAQSALERQAEIFESYPGAFALHLVQEDGEPLKNKKGEIPAIYLHVVKTWETPDLVKTYETPEAHLAEPSEEHQQVSRRGSETSFAAKEMQMKAEKEEVEKIRMQTQLTEEQMSMDLERLEQDMDRKISQVPDPSLQDSPAVTRLPEVIERTVNDSQSARPQNVSQASTPSPGVPIKAPSSPSPVPTSPLGRPSKRLSAGVEDMTRIFGERANVRGPEPHGDSGRSPRLLDDSASAKKGEFDSASAKKGEFFEICRQGERGSYPVVLELECKHLPRSEFSRSSFVCLLQVGDLYFQTSTTSSGAFQDGNIFKFVLQTDEVVQVAVVDLNRTMMDNVIGHASMPAEKLVHDFGQQSEFQILRSDGLGVMDGKTRRASLVVARCRPCAPAEMDEALKAGIVTEKGYKPVTPRDAQQIISNKISIFDGREDFCRQRLYLKIVAARHITFRSNLLRFCNPYCKVRIGEQRFQTHKCIATIEPDWCGDTFDLEVVSRKDQLQIQVLDWDMLEMDRVIGYVKVPIGQLLRETIEGNKKAPSKTTSSSSVAWTGKNISSSSAFDKSSHGSAAFEKAVSTSSAAFSENSDDSSNRASYKLFTADGCVINFAM
jgi:C-terminal processing protease CtpA/Prc